MKYMNNEKIILVKEWDSHSGIVLSGGARNKSQKSNGNLFFFLQEMIVDVLNPIGAATNQSTNEVHWIGTIFPFVLKKRNETEIAGT